MSRFNRIPDEELKIAGSKTLTPGGDGSTANTTAVAIGSVGAGDEDLELIVNITALAGTHDASHYMTLTLEAGETSGGTFYDVKSIQLAEIATGVNKVAFNTQQIIDSVGSSDAAYYRIKATQTGTTATAITLDAYFSRGV